MSSGKNTDIWDIQLFKLNFDEKELNAVSNVVSSGWLTMGEETNKFESNFESFLGSDVLCSAVSNCTAALHMALLALDVGVGDEVIIPSLTFVADINVVKLVGATPILADSTSLNNWNISLGTIESLISKKTKAMIVVHYAGYPIHDIEGISQLCQNKGIRLIEDVAHAPGAMVGMKKCGTFGDVGCFSFFSNKNISIGEGGMVCTQNPKLHEKLRLLRSHGMTSLTLDRHKGRTTSYDVVQPGLNYRMDEMRSAIGSVQLEKLSNGNIKRGELTQHYRNKLNYSLIEIPFSNQPSSCVSAYHILPVLLPADTDRNLIIKELKEKRIQSSIHYPPFWNFSAYKNKFIEADSPIAAEICRRELTLPLFPKIKKEEIDMITDSLLEIIK